MDLTARYQRAGDLLRRRARRQEPRRPGVPAASTPFGGGIEEVAEIQSRLKARETPPARFCWHCRKPLHARSDKCPFCQEKQ